MKAAAVPGSDAAAVPVEPAESAAPPDSVAEAESAGPRGSVEPAGSSDLQGSVATVQADCHHPDSAVHSPGPGRASAHPVAAQPEQAASPASAVEPDFARTKVTWPQD